MSNEQILGPIQFEGKIHMVHPEGHHATVTFKFAPGRPITVDGIESALRTAQQAVEEQGFILMGPSTFFNHVLVKEKTGRSGNFAITKDFQFDAFGMETHELPRSDVYDECDEEE